jgi:predicted O-methyltransferase YrrM|tara:strand:+ start:7088 stop:7690 length:603 start_codon:yes stop_codon:yes gene_type:complete
VAVHQSLLATLYYLRFPWLRRSRAIFSHLTSLERVALYQLAGSRPMKSVVEIGSYLGASAYAFAAALERRDCDGKVYCIDTWSNEAMSEGQRDTMVEFQLNTAVHSSSIVTIRGHSTSVVEQVEQCAKKIDLLFIDADHSYEGCLADWKAYSSLLADDAIVVIHDVGWAEGVKRVVDTEVRPLADREGCLPNMWWCWITP